MPETVNTARELVLSGIRAANAGVGAEERAAAYENVERGYQRAAELSGAVLVELFAERLREYDAQVHESRAENVADTVANALAANGEQGAVVVQGFPERWLPGGFAWRAEVTADTSAMSRATGAITTCEVAIAHTGSIVVKGARRLTLLPDRLLCVVEERQIVETVPEAFARLEASAKDALTFISGPSATADIEMTRIRGVHGPRFLDVVIVRG
jgi:L-lactate dehydrogenase complex protein LldG